MHADTDTWDPDRYDRFRDQRTRPAMDLLDLVRPAPGGTAIDLGCGTGRLTAQLHHRVRASTTIGIDTSAAMLAQASEHAVDGVSFAAADLQDAASGRWTAGAGAGQWDVVFANASLQWVPDHLALLPHLVERLAPGGQLAFQVPANFAHPSHVVADEIGRRYGLDPLDRTIGAKRPASYAEALHAAGLRDLDVTERIYGHEMARTDDVLAWVSGTLLTSFEQRLGPEAFVSFRREYRDELLRRLGDPAGDGPYFYAFPRILVWGRRPGGET